MSPLLPLPDQLQTIIPVCNQLFRSAQNMQLNIQHCFQYTKLVVKKMLAQVGRYAAFFLMPSAAI